MSNWYKSVNTETKVVRHLHGFNLLIILPSGDESRISVSEEIADMVDSMMEIAYMSGKERVRSEIRSKLGLNEGYE